MTNWMKFNLSESASPIMEQLMYFHDHTMMMLTFITITVMMMMYLTMLNKYTSRNILENQPMEITWTIMPAGILILIAIPSIKILYLMEEMINPLITIKTMGHQWYWSYEYSDNNKMEIESYMNKSKKKKNNFRLIDVDNRIVMPFLTQIRMIISSSDVIHSWTIQSIGIKMDAIPGRLNQTNLMINKPGLFFGQCSEICGMNHSFMPISIESINMNNFLKWIK